MRIFNRFILALAVASGLINTILAFLGQNDIKMYFTVNTIAFLAITLLHVYLNPRAKRGLDTIASVFFAGFLVTVIVMVMEIVSGR